MRLILAICVVALTIVSAEPPRPDPHETFESQSTVYLKLADFTAVGQSRFAVDQPHGSSLEEIRYFHNHSSHSVFELQRFDQGLNFGIRREGQPPQPVCKRSPLKGAMPTVWQWMRTAQYKGRETVRGQTMDIWMTKDAGFEMQAGFTVDTQAPLYFSRKTADEQMEMHFTHYAQKQPNSTWFEVPQLCKGDDVEMLDGDDSKQAPELQEPEFDNTTVPNGCSAVVACATKISTCGCPYVWGGNGPCCDGKKAGFDCSGMTSHCMAAGGYRVGRTAAEQQKNGAACSGSPVAGDLMFVGTPAHHVFMYIGGGKIAECPHTGANCHVIAEYAHSGGCRRIC